MKYSRGARKRLVLEATPYDKWVRAGEIASDVGLTPRNVGIIINRYLIPSHIKKKEIDNPRSGTPVYKRLPFAL